MKIKIITCIVFFIIPLNLYSAHIPDKVSSIPENAVWDGQRWRDIDIDRKKMFTWYKDGKMETQSGFIIINGKYKPDGKIILWGKDGVKIMEEEWAKGEIVKRFNYRIDFQNYQRPLNIPQNAIWDSKNNFWVFMDFQTLFWYIWYINGELKLEAQFYLSNLKTVIFSGKYIERYQNGNIKEESFRKEDCIDGIQILRNESGEMTEKSYYQSGYAIWTHRYDKAKPVNLKDVEFWDAKFKKWGRIKDNVKIDYHDNGNIGYTIEMRGNDYHGKHQAFFKNGELGVDGQYKNSKKDGIWIYYFIDGKMEKVYEEGLFIKSTKIINP